MGRKEPHFGIHFHIWRLPFIHQFLALSLSFVPPTRASESRWEPSEEITEERDDWGETPTLTLFSTVVRETHVLPLKNGHRLRSLSHVLRSFFSCFYRWFTHGAKRFWFRSSSSSSRIMRSKLVFNGGTAQFFTLFYGIDGVPIYTYIYWDGRCYSGIPRSFVIIFELKKMVKNGSRIRQKRDK